MKILITGTTGYIAMRLIPVLLQKQYELVCCVRSLQRIPEEYKTASNISFIEVDFLKEETLLKIPEDIDVAYYLIHSMSTSSKNFKKLERICAQNFKEIIESTYCKQVIYLSGIVNDKALSEHLQSRKNVERRLQSSFYKLTTFRAGIIVGSGSASFEIIRDLVEKLPVMITPKWLNTKTHPIAIRDIIFYLENAILKELLYNKSFDVFGPEVLTYKQMLLQYAEIRGLKRLIITLPIMTPKLSSYWLFFVTSTTYNLAISLVDSMKVEVIGKPSDISIDLPHETIDYKQAVKDAFEHIEQNTVISSWKDAVNDSRIDTALKKHIKPPSYGCFKDIRVASVQSTEKTVHKIWTIGGDNGWYYGNFLWKIRGYIDLLFGGVGLRRGRTDSTQIQVGDAVDFWRVLYANKEEQRLLLFAEMKVPGEAWLEFNLIKNKLYQRAIFRPKGIWGRLYWYAVLPFHGIIFKGLIRKLTEI